MKIIVYWIGGIVFSIAVITSLAWADGAYDCWSKLSDSGHEYGYNLLKGCRYKADKGWLQYDRLRDLGA